MKGFKGTNEIWKDDIGMDELNENLFQIIVFPQWNETFNVAHVFGRTHEETEANAKLVASAPEMLESLQSMVSMYESLANNNMPMLLQDKKYLQTKKLINKILD